MSWTFQFKVEDGKIDVESVFMSGEVPEGHYSLNGHKDDKNQSLNIGIGDYTYASSISVRE